MGMIFAPINFQFPINGTAEAIVRNHSTYRPLDKQFGMAHPARPDVFRFMATDVTGKAHESFLLFFFAGHPHLVSIDDDHEIAGIDVWSENRFFLSAQ